MNVRYADRNAAERAEKNGFFGCKFSLVIPKWDPNYIVSAEKLSRDRPVHPEVIIQLIIRFYTTRLIFFVEYVFDTIIFLKSIENNYLKVKIVSLSMKNENRN